jgi:hypothetical protein
MNRYIQSVDGVVLFRMTRDAEHYTPREGKFEVRYQRRHTRFFPTLLEAFLFYYTVDDEAELWDKTTRNVLIESKIKLFLN